MKIPSRQSIIICIALLLFISSNFSCKKSACKNVTCLNGGICDEGSCDCPPQYGGENCQLVCPNSVCLNGGQSAINANSNCYCDCPPQYGGENCQLTCPNSVCLNGGQSAINANNNCYCDCPPQYGGENCQLTCPNSVCLNGGQGAIDANSNCYCDCPAGFSGTSCEVQDLCYNVECPTNAECDPTDGECYCNPGYEGSNCNTLIRAKYFTSYSGQDVCPSGTYAYISSILTSAQGVEYMIIQGFGGFGNAPSAGCPANPFNIVAKVVDIDNFLIQDQTPAACNLRIWSGDATGADNLGFRDNATGIITLTYTVVFTDTTPPAGETCDMVLSPL